MTKSVQVIETLQQYISSDDFQKITGVDIANKSAAEIIDILKQLFSQDAETFYLPGQSTNQQARALVDIIKSNGLNFSGYKQQKLRTELTNLLDLNFAQSGVYEDIMGNTMIANTHFINALNDNTLTDKSKALVRSILGLKLYYNKNYHSSISLLEHALELDPNFENSTQARYCIGRAYEQHKIFEDALQAFAQVIKNDKSNKFVCQSHLYTAKIYYQQGMYDKSIEHLESILQNENTDINDILQIYCILGGVFESNQLFEKAFQAYQSILNNDTTQNLTDYTKLRIGQVYAMQNDYVNAEKKLLECIHSSDEFVSVVTTLYLIELYSNQKRYDEAIILGDPIIKKYSNISIFYTKLAEIYSNDSYEKNNKTLAIEYFQKALEIEINNEEYLDASEIREKIKELQN